MCGIVGVYNRSRERPVEREILEAQTETLVHRGPDGGGVWTAPGIGLGHRRLSIIDLAAGRQPMFDASGRYALTFNGEIYNYRALRDELRALGHVFSTDSDSEVLLLAYVQWGPACVERFNGMFAFAVYDSEEHSLLLARDRLGKKPLFYYSSDERVVFGSELKALLSDPMVPREIDATAVADFFALAYVPGPKTIFRGLRKLPAGCTLLLQGKKQKLTRYWDVRYDQVDFSAKPEAFAEELLALLQDSVELRLRADVPLGAFLSGGVDSSAVVALMAGCSSSAPRTQSVGFDIAAFDERKYARQIAERFACEHSEQVLSPDAGHVVHQLSHFYDEPFGDSSAIPTYYLCQETRRQVTVALSGDGGDELFAGYNHYAIAQWTQSIHRRLPRLVWQAASLPLAQLFHVSRYSPKLYRYNRLLWRASADPDRNAYNNLLPQPWRYRELLNPELLGALGDYDPFESVAHWYAGSGSDDFLSRMQYADTKAYLCDDILVKVDRASMAHSLEVRCPLLDHRVVELAARIPPLEKMRESQGKVVLKRAIQGLIEPAFFERDKQGFAIPQDQWFQSAWRPLGEELLLRGGSRLLGHRKLRRVWREHQAGLAQHGAALYNALTFELWYQRYIDGAGPSVAPTEGMKSSRPAVHVQAPTGSSSSG